MKSSLPRKCQRSTPGKKGRRKNKELFIIDKIIFYGIINAFPRREERRNLEGITPSKKTRRRFPEKQKTRLCITPPGDSFWETHFISVEEIVMSTNRPKDVGEAILVGDPDRALEELVAYLEDTIWELGMLMKEIVRERDVRIDKDPYYHYIYRDCFSIPLELIEGELEERKYDLRELHKVIRS